MSTRNFARIFGIVFLLVGAAGFVPPLMQPAQGGAIAPGVHHDLLFGMFPMNALHNGVHIGFGIWGLIASRVQRHSLLYARVTAIAYAAMWLAGYVPGLDDMFGILPLYGNDTWLHLLLAVVAAYFGWVNRSPVIPSRP